MSTPIEQVEQWVEAFSAAMAESDASVLALFEPAGLWRDVLAFTWNITTQAGQQNIGEMLAATRVATKAINWRCDGEPVLDPAGWVGCWLRFESAAGSGRAHVRLRDGLAWTLVTSLVALHDQPWLEAGNRARGYDYGADWSALRRDQRAALGDTVQPDVVIIGGGQGGMGLGARLQALDVSYLIVDSHPRPGDCWRHRYDSLKLHDPVWYDHMPYIDFPAGWPIYTPKDRMADWLEMYAKVMDLNYWSSARAEEASYDGENWSLNVNCDGEIRRLSPKHIVFATGMSGYPRIPEFEGTDAFAGAFIHSTEFRNGSDYKGGRAVV
ncbi:MAG: NAD(P)-binding domain-containing protein, partial [Pikeienuella sp.]